MKTAAIIMTVFYFGYKFGYWDAKYGAETGERWGKATKTFIMERLK